MNVCVKKILLPVLALCVSGLVGCTPAADRQTGGDTEEREEIVLWT